MSPDVARVVLPAESSAGEEVSSDEELPRQSNMWCPLLEAGYHHSIGGYLAMSMCNDKKAPLSETCFALFVNSVARAATVVFLTLCAVLGLKRPDPDGDRGDGHSRWHLWLLTLLPLGEAGRAAGFFRQTPNVGCFL